MTSLLDCSPPPRRVGMQGSRRRKGKGGIAVVTKEFVEWDVSTDNYHATAPASMMPSLKQWHNPLYRHVARTSSSSFEDDAATTREIDIDSGRPSVRDLGSTCDDAGTRSGRGWTIAVCALMGCRDVYGVSVSLDLVAEVVLGLPSCELQKAAKEFDAVIQEKRAALPCIFVPSVEKLVVSVAKRFKMEATGGLPLHVLQYILGFISLAEQGELCAVSKDFQQSAEGDGLWREAYADRFHKNKDYRPSRSKAPKGGYKGRFKRRIQDPQVDDEVEVAWRGKFRLESLEVYNGMAWWVARVVRKGGQKGCYQVHYPGWEARWDEWVPRDRLRWGNERRANALAGISPAQGDSVEMWCEGVHVPGAWLEAMVHSVKHGRLYLGEVLTSGHFWVDADHVRLVKRGSGGSDGNGRQGRSRTHRRGCRRTFSWGGRGVSREGARCSPGRSGGSCCVT